MAQTWNAMILPSAPTVIVERRTFDLATIPPHKASLWRPIVVIGKTPFDPETQVRTGPVTTIEATQVVDTFTVRAKTTQELDNEKDGQFDNANPMLKKLLFDTHKRLNVLEGKPAGNLAAYRAYARSL